MIKKLLLIISLFLVTLANDSFNIEKYSYIADTQKVKEYLSKTSKIPDQALLNAGYKIIVI